MPPKSVNFQQIRGSWIAMAATSNDAHLVGHTRVPVIRDFANGDFTWSREGVTVRVTPDTSKDEKSPLWWMLDKNAEWRSLLEAGIPTLIRKGTGSDAGFGENSVGRKVGLFIPASVTIAPEVLELRFTSRLPLMLTQ
jgi:hypothetical protein